MESLAHLEESSPSKSAEQKWSSLKEATYKAASEILGFHTYKYKDWFDDQNTEAQALLDEMHSTHLAWINDKNNTSKKSVYTRDRFQRERSQSYFDSGNSI